MSDRSHGRAASVAPNPSSPFRLNLEQQRKRAKELLRALRAGEPQALRRFRLHHPLAGGPLVGGMDGPGLPGRLARLSEAQLVIARELGLPSWPRLVAHVAASARSLAGIERGDPAPDRDMTTLHLRCGSDIGPGLREAGFVGEFLEYSDPFCQGPVPDAPDWLERRADFLSHAYGAGTGMSRAEITAKLHLAEESLLAAPARYERIVLWFEHDTYDQLILARCLAHFARTAPPRLELVSPARYPGSVRFIGLGQLPPEALRLLWAERTPVPIEALHAGGAVWDALRAPDPRPLAALAREGTPGIPQLGRAVRRHCRELPWTTDGLGLTQRLILQLVAEAPRMAGQVFHALMTEREPLPWMTDLICHDMVEGLRAVERPVLAGRYEDADRRWFREHLTITPLGRAVLAGTVDWLSLGPRPRWVGGVSISGSGPCWRWDEDGAAAVQR
ncbi:DUF1835 domain-containing protein [Roseomonas sp. NAR14]|uniref:DUF1835 domain-containing protein n=1 Tax=Roseomonas acroporae TaxID=2937791 RepID=A0A9X2BVR0_9PROT|nr:DUF1835 domain-containing protein [Roseomonas acroporae]MCK8783015.1 DUF1835 domain-containing protein [Roseomonas acroporae]